jgi:hypothetical protein
MYEYSAYSTRDIMTYIPVKPSFYLPMNIMLMSGALLPVDARAVMTR